MGLDEKPTNTASQTSKFAVLISAITLLVFFGGLLHVELILNTRVRHLEAQIQSMQPSKVPFSDSETVNLESKTKPSNKEQHQQNENNYGKPVKKAETPTEDECDYGPDCVQQLENNQNFFHANRMRRDIAMFMLFSNQTLEHLKKELSTTIYQRLKNVILTQKKLPKDPKSKLSVNRIRQALRKIISWKFDGLPGHDGPTGPKGEMGYQGRKGSKGSTGFPGLRGTNEYKLGDTGHAGSKGDVGLQGPKGDKGQKGDLGNGDLKGYPGLPGPRGFRGEEGDTGTTGPQGVPGLPGLQGKKGKEGFPGEQGLFASCKRCE